MSLLIEEVYSDIANAMAIPLWEMPMIGMPELNAEVGNVPKPCLAYFGNQTGRMVLELHNSIPFIEYTTAVYFFIAPADESADSLQSAKRQLLKMASEFTQRFGASDAYTGPTNNPPFAPSFAFFYPVLDERLSQLTLSFTCTLDLELPHVCPQ